MRRIRVKYEGKCRTCRKSISEGSLAVWERGLGIWHLDCAPSESPRRGVTADDFDWTPSHYQQAIFDWCRHGEGNLIVNAVAGSGKTTTMLRAVVEHLGGSVLFLCFNKSIERELSPKVPKSAEARTTHSMCYELVRKYNSDIREPHPSKVRWILDERYPTKGVRGKTKQKNRQIKRIARKLVSISKATLVDEHDEQAVREIMDHYGIYSEEGNREIEEIAIKALPSILQECRDQDDIVDYDDMIWFVHQFDLQPTRRFDWVIIDEAQDLNRLQIETIGRFLKPSGRFIAIGDPCQAIYGFRGADSQAMERIRTKFECKELPLSVCYRCPRSHLELAQEIVPHVEPREDAPEGDVAYLDWEEGLAHMKTDDLVLCRLNAPLVRVCYSLIRLGVKCTIKGRDIGEGLINLIDQVAPGARTCGELLPQISQYQHVQAKRLRDRNKGRQAESVEDRCRTIIYLTEGIDTVTSLKARIKEIFTDKVKGVVCSTVHKAKGLEAENVHIVAPDRLPLWHPTQKEWEVEQEWNIKYVALTRAKRSLTFVSDPKEV